MKYLIAFLLFLTAAHADDWAPADTKREAAYLTLHAVDWAQTRQIAKNPDKWIEHNPILGSHPLTKDVNKYFAVTGLSHVVIAYCLPAEYRKIFQYVSISFEGAMVANNVSIGIRL